MPTRTGGLRDRNKKGLTCNQQSYNKVQSSATIEYQDAIKNEWKKTLLLGKREKIK